MMKNRIKYLSLFVAIALTLSLGIGTLGVFADDLSIQNLDSIPYEEMPTQEFLTLDEISQISEMKEAQSILNTQIGQQTLVKSAKSSSNTRGGVWAIYDTVFNGTGSLATSQDLDIYIVDITSTTKAATLKLTATNSNMIAYFYYMNPNGTLGSFSGWGVYANDGWTYAGIPTGQYAIIIANAAGSYTLMWNCSNPWTGATAFLDVTSNLSRVVLGYDYSTIRSNGVDILQGLEWSESYTLYNAYGYNARNVNITAYDLSATTTPTIQAARTAAKGVYKGSFSSSAPYSTSNALLIELNGGTYFYCTTFYQNIGGQVTHIIDKFDPSGLETSRHFGRGYADFSYGPSYIVIDLNTFQVVEFLSAFNYHYTNQGGRTFSLTNFVKIY